MKGMANARLGAAIVALCTVAALHAHARPQAASGSTKQRQDAPLRFDPPAAGAPQQANAAYESCIANPSPDGVGCSCEHLLPGKPAAKPRRHR